MDKMNALICQESSTYSRLARGFVVGWNDGEIA